MTHAGVLNESRLTVSDAAKLFPGSTPTGHATVGSVYKWLRHGVKSGEGRIRLEGVVIGSCWWTSREAVGRFIEATTAAAIGGTATPAPPQERKRKATAAGGKLRGQWGAK